MSRDIASVLLARDVLHVAGGCRKGALPSLLVSMMTGQSGLIRMYAISYRNLLKALPADAWLKTEYVTGYIIRIVMNSYSLRFDGPTSYESCGDRPTFCEW